MAGASRSASMLLLAGALLAAPPGRADPGDWNWLRPVVTVDGTVLPLETSGGPSDASANPGLDLFYLYLDQDSGLNWLETRPIAWPYRQADLGPTHTIDLGLIFSLGNTVPKPGGGGSVMPYIKRELVDPFPSNVWITNVVSGTYTAGVVSPTVAANYFDVDSALTSEGIVLSAYNTDLYQIDIFRSQDEGQSFQLVWSVTDPFLVIGPIFSGVRQRIGGDPTDPVLCGTYEQNGTGHIFGYELDLASLTTPAVTSLVTIPPPMSTGARAVEATLARIDGECWGAANGRGQLIAWHFANGAGTALAGPAMVDMGVSLFEANDLINVVTPQHHMQTNGAITVSLPAPPGLDFGPIANMGRSVADNVYLPIVLKGGSVVLAEFGAGSAAIPVFGRWALGVAALALLLAAGLRLRRERGA